MKKEDFLKLGLNEEMATISETASLEELKAYVPYERFKILIDEKNDLKIKNKERDDQLETLKKSAGNNNELTKQIEDLQEANKHAKLEYEANLKNIRIDSEIKAKLSETKYSDLLTGKFDKSKIVISDDGVVTGIDEQLISIKKAYKDLFVPILTGKEPNTPPIVGNKEITKEQFQKMTYQERTQLYNADKDTYDSLSSN